MTNQKLLASSYKDARQYLLDRIPRKDAVEVLNHYLSLPDGSEESASIETLYFHLLSSAQNANMKAGVIGGAIGGVEKLGKVLCGFSPKKVVTKYNGQHMKLLSDIESYLKPTGKIRKTPQSIWPKYCNTALDSAEFFSQFESGNDFYSWANHYYQDSRSIAALPLVLSQEIYGIGYPLACDFLKELGFINYGKPDVHIIEIFKGLGLCDDKATPYEIQKVIVQIAEVNGVSAYNVDKLFWLIGSGKFYDHPDIGNIGRNRQDFVQQYNA